MPFVPGTGSAKLDETLELTQAAVDLGADIALVITPYYSRPTQDGLYEWYSTVARTFPDMPIVLYNVPIRTAVDVAPETVARLRRDYANVVGIKETTKDFEHFSRVFHAVRSRHARVVGHRVAVPAAARRIGGIGFVSAVANLAPSAVAQMYDTVSAATTEEALDIHYGLHPLVDLMFVETNPAPIKSVLSRAGHIGSPMVRPPLVTPTAAGARRIDQLLLVAGAPMLEGRLADLAATVVNTP